MHLALIALSLVSACAPPEAAPDLMNWPGFSEEVIQIGRASLIKTHSARNAPGRARSEYERWRKRIEDVPAPPATSEGILTHLSTHDDAVLTRDFQEMGKPALELLLEIIADDTVRLAVRDRAAEHAMRFGRDLELFREVVIHGSLPIELRPLTDDAARITESLLEYLAQNPQASLPSWFVEIVPFDSLPLVVTLLSEHRPHMAFEAVRIIAHASFPPRLSLGHISPEQARLETRARQNWMKREVRKWWLEHCKDSYERCAQRAARRVIESAIKRDNSGDDTDVKWYDYRARLGPSVFGLLVAEFDRVPDGVRPFMLGMIARTHHAQAAELVARHLDDPDTRMKRAALGGLLALGADQYSGQIRALLAYAEDKELIQEVLRALYKLVGPQALEAYVPLLSHPDNTVSGTAESLLRSYLTSHRRELRIISRTCSDRETRKKLSLMLDKAVAEEAVTDTAEATIDGLVDMVCGFLRSHDRQRVLAGIRLVGQGELVELVPELIALLDSDDEWIPGAVSSVVWELGIPELTVQNAHVLMGHSSGLDKQIAAYCYAKYGRPALPLVERVAYELNNNERAALRYDFPPTASVGLLRILINEGVEGVEDKLINTIKDSEQPQAYIPVLSHLSGSASAQFVGELLRDSTGAARGAAISVTRARRLKQHVDLLFRIATDDLGAEGWKRLNEDYYAHRISLDEINESYHRPGQACQAAQVLIAFGDLRGWEAAEHCLDSGYVDCWKSASSNGFSIGDHLDLSFGVSMSRLVPDHRAGIRRFLEHEIQKPQRDSIVTALTTALSYSPGRVDESVLFRVVRSPEAPMRARILAAVALSKLGVSKVVPVLRGWVEESLGDPNSDAGRAQRRLLFRTARTDENQRAESEEQRLLSVQIAPQGVSWRLARHHVEMADALARLGDYTLVDEALDALVDIRGQFQSYAYHVLVQLLGARAYPRAAEHLRRKDPLLLRSLRWYALDQLDSPDMRAEAVRLLRENDDLLLSKRSLVKKLQLVEVSDRLVELFQEYARDGSSMVSFVLETLCELGDPRALALASDDPLLLARLAPYLAGAPLDAALDRSSKYNRVQDALVLQQWYRLNADALLWDGAIRRFKIEG